MVRWVGELFPFYALDDIPLPLVAYGGYPQKLRDGREGTVHLALGDFRPVIDEPEPGMAEPLSRIL